MTDRSWTRAFSVTRTGVLLLLVGHLLACIGVIALLGRGWRWRSAESFGYRVLPAVVGLVLLLAIALPRRWNVDRVALAMLIGLWIGVGVGAVIWFPVSGVRIGIGCAGFAVVLAAALVAGPRERRHLAPSPGTPGEGRGEGSRNAKDDSRPKSPHPSPLPGYQERGPAKRPIAVAIFLGLLASPIVVALLAAPSLSTRPIASVFGPLAGGVAERRNVRIDPRLTLDTTGATLIASVGRRVVYVEPLLTFNQRSPDGCWTIFASRADRLPPLRTLDATDVGAGSASATYRDVDRGRTVASYRLDVARVGDDRFDVDARATLPATAWSHLNTFAQVTVAGHRSLRLRFSATGDASIDVGADGAPARFAYVDAAGTFRVVEATSAEKGPFRTLAEGPIGGGPLTITPLDGNEPFMAITLEDWASQASTAASPSAGWGVPQNAIEFGLAGDRPAAPASIFVSLAATSVGRGWQSVGHGPGTYRNRMRITFPSTAPAAAR